MAKTAYTGLSSNRKLLFPNVIITSVPCYGRSLAPVSKPAPAKSTHFQNLAILKLEG
jgi:hypothetical protein